MADDPIIHSRLMKADYLVGNSQIFPVLVRGACAYTGVPYSQDALLFCATRPVILDGITMTENTALDQVLRDFGTDPSTAGEMDNMILTAVEQYKEQN